MQPHLDHHPPDGFPTDPSGLPEAGRPRPLELADGDTLKLRIAPVAKRLGEATVRMLAYNGSIPGPTLKVRQGSELVVQVENQGDLEATVHWHGLRLENRYDGVPHETQAPIPVGGEFTYRIQFPDAGLYWYHPHIREDYTQELGLYANILVVPADAGLLAAGRPRAGPDPGRPVAGGRQGWRRSAATETSYAAMGRFGNVFLTSGEPGPPAGGAGGGGGAAVADQHRQHPGVQPGRAGRADEAGRRGQRPGRARGARRPGAAGAVGAGGGRRAGRPAGRAGPGAPHPRPDLPAGHAAGGRGAGRAVTGSRDVRAAAPGSGAGRRATAAGRPGWPRHRTRSWPWSPRWTTRPPCRTARARSPTPVPCTPRSPARSPAAAPSAA